jgi:hypothetical protein
MPKKDFTKTGEHVAILHTQGPNVRERTFEHKFQTDEFDRIAGPVEAYARRH